MSEHKQEKWLYTFEINKTTEVEKQVEEVINGEAVKVTRKIKEEKPIKFALLRPNRRLYEEADLFYAIELSKNIKAGLLTKPLLFKRYRNDGGALSDPDVQYFAQLTTEFSDLDTDHQRFVMNLDKLSKEDNDKRIQDVVVKKTDVLQRLQALETINQQLFAHTAEAKAERKLVNWWITTLSYWDEKSDDKFVSFFPGEDFDKKMLKWDDYDSVKDSFIYEALTRFSVLVGLWNAGARETKDFEQGEKDFGSIPAVKDESKQ